MEGRSVERQNDRPETAEREGSREIEHQSSCDNDMYDFDERRQVSATLCHPGQRGCAWGWPGTEYGTNRVTVSENEWVDETVMLSYLSWVHFAVGCSPCALILDSFPGHLTARIPYQVRCLQIELIPVPKSMTGEFQPLNRGCFGPLKKKESTRLRRAASDHD
jgi:hypothetical protein